MESQTPWCLFAFTFEADSSVELNPDGQVPLEGLLIVVEPHGFVVVDQVLRRILIKQALDVHQDVEEVVLAWSHNLSVKWEGEGDKLAWISD